MTSSDNKPAFASAGKGTSPIPRPWAKRLTPAQFAAAMPVLQNEAMKSVISAARHTKMLQKSILFAAHYVASGGDGAGTIKKLGTTQTKNNGIQAAVSKMRRNPTVKKLIDALNICQLNADYATIEERKRILTAIARGRKAGVVAGESPKISTQNNIAAITELNRMEGIGKQALDVTMKNPLQDEEYLEALHRRVNESRCKASPPPAPAAAATNTTEEQKS